MGEPDGAMVERARRLLARVVASMPDGGEERAGQQAMAEAVARSFATGRHLVVQAGTGTGKSLAYLVPAVLAGRRIVVSTATKALQEQLAGKDLPLLARALGTTELRWTVLKGRSNYLCRQKVAEIAGTDDRLALGDGAETGLGEQVAGLVRWADETRTGDRSELTVEPDARAWSAVSTGPRECPGATRCAHGDTCFAEQARRAAGESDVVIVNHHLYATHVTTAGAVLPDHDTVVIDEVHELEDVATHAFGVELTEGRFRALARSLGALGVARGTVDDVDGIGVRLTAAIADRRDERLAGDDPELVDALTAAATRLSATLQAARDTDVDDADGEARRNRVVAATGALVDDLQVVVGAGRDADDHVVWVEGPPHAPSLRCAPIVVDDLLAAGLWSQTTAVLTSATVPLHAAERLGLPADGHDELDVGSPFDHRGAGILYCARHLPDPRHERWADAAVTELGALITAAGGRTLALFTSWAALDRATDRLRDELDVPILAQRDHPKPELLRRFADDEATCLFATMGFWQGVDVPGRTLSLVVIDRLPFRPPSDPLTAARRERAGDRAFTLVDLPRVGGLLAQGAGRLLRTQHDRGVVAVLDPRLATKGYRRELLARFPSFRRSVDRSEVERFLRSVAGDEADTAA